MDSFNLRKLRIGKGKDVHALVSGRKLIIGGVEIPFDKGLEGHSDADVLAHAIGDAILGAIRGGDLGKLFPDTDPAYEGADSMMLLSEIARRAQDSGYEIIDIDSVIVAQEPKMAPYREQMRGNIAKALGMPIDNIGIKATTTEHLGYEGRGEGISADAVCIAYRCSTNQTSIPT